jgi:hypothetical protein
VQVTTQFNPAIIPGIYVNIQSSGWYLVNETDGNGTLLLTLVRSAEGASGTITAGKLVVPSGFPGASIVGPQGPPGSTGQQGPPGPSFTTTNGFYFTLVGTDFPLPLVSAPVDFVSSAPAFVFPSPGLYLLTAVISIEGAPGVIASDTANFKFRNQSLSVDIQGTDVTVSNIANGQLSQVSITCRVQTDNVNQTVALFGSCSTDSKIVAKALQTRLTYVRLQ